MLGARFSAIPLATWLGQVASKIGSWITCPPLYPWLLCRGPLLGNTVGQEGVLGDVGRGRVLEQGRGVQRKPLSQN